MKDADTFAGAVHLVACGMLLLSLAGHSGDCLAGGAAPEGPSLELKPTWAELFRAKPGTEYLDGMPKEIIWIEDGAEMVLVPASKFLFGEENESKEEPAFYIDKFPVTNERYKRFVDAAGHRVPFMAEEWAKPYNWARGTYPEGQGNHPAVLLDWNDVVAYCRWAGKSFPSEFQWEKAARGTDGRLYPWGNDVPESTTPARALQKRGLLGLALRRLVWFRPAGLCNSWHAGLGRTTAVDQYPRGVSPYGCYDMAGNVWEWTSTQKSPGWVVKGGSWFDGDVRVRSTAYGVVRPLLRGNNLGFRCAVVLP